MMLENEAGSTPIVYETNRKYISDFRGVPILIFGSFAVVVGTIIQDSSQKSEYS